MPTQVVFPEITIHTEADISEGQLARLVLAFAAAFALENGNQIVISAARWQELSGKPIHMDFEVREDRAIMHVEVTGALFLSDQPGTAASAASPAVATSPEEQQDGRSDLSG